MQFAETLRLSVYITDTEAVLLHNIPEFFRSIIIFIAT